MSKCILIEYPEWGGCCCQCKYRLRLLGLFQRESGCFPQVGWVCTTFACETQGDKREAIAYKGDFEHGMCELYKEAVPCGT